MRRAGRPAGRAGGRGPLAVLRALGDRTRLSLFRILLSRKAPAPVGRLVARLRVRQPTVSHHLLVLRRAGLASVVRRGTRSLWSASREGLAVLRRDLDRLARRPGQGRRP